MTTKKPPKVSALCRELEKLAERRQELRRRLYPILREHADAIPDQVVRRKTHLGYLSELNDLRLIEAVRAVTSDE